MSICRQNARSARTPSARDPAPRFHCLWTFGWGSVLTDPSCLVGVVGSPVLTAPRDAVDETPANVLRPSGRVPAIRPSRGDGISP
jgi:hypothetical protein